MSTDAAYVDERWKLDLRPDGDAWVRLKFAQVNAHIYWFNERAKWRTTESGQLAYRRVGAVIKLFAQLDAWQSWVPRTQRVTLGRLYAYASRCLRRTSASAAGSSYPRN